MRCRARRRAGAAPHHLFRRSPGRLRTEGRRRRRHVGGQGAPRQVRLRDQRRHRPLARIRPALARRRKAEVEAADKSLGVETEVLDIHDGELEPTLENRKTITRLIREWKADIVMSHRPNDYHPDHRYTGVLVQDAAFMVAVPKLLPGRRRRSRATRSSSTTRIASRSRTRSRPTSWWRLIPSRRRKLAALERMESQFYEGGAVGGPELVPDDPTEQGKRRATVRAGFQARDRGAAKQFRDKLKELYGAEQGDKVEFAEAFEVCEYGRQPDGAELRRLFPFFDK